MSCNSNGVAAVSCLKRQVARETLEPSAAGECNGCAPNHAPAPRWDTEWELIELWQMGAQVWSV